MPKKIIVSEEEPKVVIVNYDLGHNALMKLPRIPKSIRERTLPIVKYHHPGLTGSVKVEIRDVSFRQNTAFNKAVRDISSHGSESGWQPVGIFEFLHYLQKFPRVYQGNRMVYALGHIYDVDGHDHVLSATDKGGHLDFEPLHFIRGSHHFSPSSVFPEFRIVQR